MDFGIAGVAAITVIAYAVGQAMKAWGRLDRWIPTVCCELVNCHYFIFLCSHISFSGSLSPFASTELLLWNLIYPYYPAYTS